MVVVVVVVAVVVVVVLWFTKDFYKANTALPTKTPIDFDKYVTAAYFFTRTITVTNLLTPTVKNKTE